VANDLLAAASRLLDTEGLDSLTVRRLCREVGVTPANFYNHYPSVEHLLGHMAAAAHDSIRALIARHAKTDASLEDKIVEATVEVVEFGVKHRDLYRVMFRQLGNMEAHERHELAREQTMAALVRLIYGDDRYRPDDIAWSHKHCHKAYAAFTYTYGLARIISMGGIDFPSRTTAERKRFVRELVWVFVRGLAAPEPV
jgi:AcrR family transcriptional regulator